MKRYTGLVLWWKPSLGYGFIRAVIDEVDPDVFVHHSQLHAPLKRLTKGDCVSFDIVKGPRGLQAVNVAIEPREECHEQETKA